MPMYDITRLDREIDAYAKAEGFSGMIRVTRRDEILYARSVGYADIEKKTAFSADSMFTLYSLSKPFCAIGLMKLVEAGKVDLGAHPSRYVSEAKGFHPSLTIHHLLTHTSGIPDFLQTKEFFEKYQHESDADMRSLLSRLTEYPAYFVPGEGAKYENSNFVIAALIIENVTGMAYAEYMKKEVFLPLGMKTAAVDRPGFEIPNRVSGYEKNDDGEIVSVPRAHWAYFGGGDMVGTVDDVYRLHVAIRDRLLLSESAWRKILTPVSVRNRGYGCTLSLWHGKDRITHNGGSAGFRTLHIQLPDDDFGIVLLSNFGYGDAREVLSEYIHTCFYGDDGSPSERVEMDKGYIKEIPAKEIRT